MNINKNYKQGAIEEAFEEFIKIHPFLDAKIARVIFFSGAYVLYVFQGHILNNGGKPEDVAHLWDELTEWKKGHQNSNESGG